jgi:hypothetical protein
VATHDALFTSDLLVSDPAGDVRLGLDRKNSFVDRTLGGWGVLPSTYFDPESAGIVRSPLSGDHDPQQSLLPRLEELSIREHGEYTLLLLSDLTSSYAFC